MEEQEQLLQIRQHLEHTVWSVGVHLSNEEVEGGKKHTFSNKETTSRTTTASVKTSLSSSDPVYDERRRFFHPVDEVNALF